MADSADRISAKSLPPAICLMGPTAAGKTELAVALAERFTAEIVSVDSALVYRGLDIGAARPDPATLARAPHHLLGLVEPEEAYSAGRFRGDALDAMAAITARERLPFLAGGTGMYFQALLRGLASMPPADADVRAALAREADRRGLAALHSDLDTVDPEAARRIHPNDPQRVLRALEVHRISGRPISSYRGNGEALPYRTLRLAVAPANRAVLHERIDRRFRAMLDAGLIPEVERLLQRPGITFEQPALRAVGYRQVADYVTGRLDYATMIERAATATRQLAKRQLTWLRGMDGVEWFDSEADPLAALSERIRRFLGRTNTDGHD